MGFFKHTRDYTDFQWLFCKNWVNYENGIAAVGLHSRGTEYIDAVGIYIYRAASRLKNTSFPRFVYFGPRMMVIEVSYSMVTNGL